MTAATADTLTVPELRDLFSRTGDPTWWVAPIRTDGTEVDGVRRLVRFRPSPSAPRPLPAPAALENAHEIGWDDCEGWGRVGAFGAWRSKLGGERCSMVGFPPVRVREGDSLTVPEGALKMPAEALER